MVSKRAKFVFSLVIALAVAVAAFAGVTPKSAFAQDASTLVVGFAQEPDTLNGFYSSMAFGQWAMDLINASLVDVNEKGELIPVLAAEIPTVANGGVSEDLKTYTVKLKSGLKWSDGTALTADDVVFTYEMIMDKANNYSQGSGIQAALESVSKVDDTTFKLVFKEGQPFVENQISNINLPGVLPAHVFKPVYEANKSLEQAPENQNPTVFSGPYLLKEWKRGESMSFVANPDFILGKPKTENVVIRFFPDTAAQYTALAAGQLDFVPNVSEGDFSSIKAQNDKLKITVVFGGYIEYLVFNLRTAEQSGEGEPAAGNPALQDIKVRQALQLALDRQAIVTDLLAGATNVTDSSYANSPFENKDVKYVAHDAAAAGKLLDEAGWVMGADGVREKDGKKLELRSATTTAAWRKNNQQYIQQQLAEVGIKITLETFPSTDFFGQFNAGGTLASGNYDLAEFANNTVLTNPVNVTVDELLGCAQIVSTKNPGGNNYTAYCSEELDKEVAITKTGKTPEERLAAAYKAQVIVANDLPALMLFPRGDNYAYFPDRFATEPRIGSGVGNQWFDIVNWTLK